MDDYLVDEEQRAYRGHQRRQWIVYGYKTEAYDVEDVADRPRSKGGNQKYNDCRRIDKAKHGKPDIGASDRGRGISHVELVHGAEDQGEADADQRIGGAEQQAVAAGLCDLDELEPEVHDLPKDIQVFYFPSGRIWYKNGNRFVAQTPIRFRKIAAEYKRQQVIKESKAKK